MQDVIDVQTTSKKSSAAPVSKKSAPISFTLTHGSQSHSQRCHELWIATFLEILAYKPSASKTTRENPRPAHQYTICFRSTPMSWDLSQTGSGVQRHSTSSLRVHGMSFLTRVRGRPNPSLLHSESPHPSRNPRAEKEEETQTSTSRRSSRQTGCCCWSSNLASQ